MKNSLSITHVPVRGRVPVRAYLALIVAIICLGFSGIFIRWAGAPNAVSAFYRMGIGSLVMVLPFLLRLRRQQDGMGAWPRREIGMAVMGGLFFAGDLFLWTTGVILSGVTIPTLLGNTAPLWVGLGAVLIFREQLGKLFWWGVLLALAGVILIVGVPQDVSAEFQWGNLLSLGAGWFYAGYLLFAQRGRRRLDSLSFYWLSTTSSALVLLLIVWLLGQPLTGYPTNTYLSFLGMGLVSQAAGYLAINYALGHLSASLVAPALLGQPVMTALLSAWLLGERFSWLQMVGGVAILAGVYVVHRGRGSD
ncbi:MAG: DMT family transporter [Chloroflexi bacterium]|nr:DMT family transporter [Chloroflexota bacterium]